MPASVVVGFVGYVVTVAPPGSREPVRTPTIDLGGALSRGYGRLSGFNPGEPRGIYNLVT
jgi:hypothetical protein